MLILCALVLGLAHCGGVTGAASGSGPALGAGGAQMTDAGADSGDAETVLTSLTFASTETLELHLKESQELVVTATPPGSYRVHFALLDSGSERDAALDVNEVVTGDDGRARVTLTAPSTPTTFSVRASVANKSVLLGVSVSALGYTRLRVLPSYSGHRPVEQWTATVSAKLGASCNKLNGTPPPDGPLSVKAAKDQPIYIDHVPVGVDLAVTLRAGHYIGGCANQAALPEADGNSVLVYASDRPLNLDATELALSFGPSDAAPAFEALLKSSANSAEAALAIAESSDVETLLDDMEAATAAENRAGFALSRLQRDWDGALEIAFGKNAKRRLRDPAKRWLSAGLQSLLAPDALQGRIEPSRSNAQFSLERVAGLSPGKAGFSSTFPATWSADSSDRLLLGFELAWAPAELAAALAVAPALLEVPGASSIEDALARTVDCSLVAQVLLFSGTPSGVPYASCDETCILNTCRVALGAAWQRARNASGSTLASLTVTASASAEVGDAAEATLATGSWLGELHLAEESATVSGALSATTPER